MTDSLPHHLTSRRKVCTGILASILPSSMTAQNEKSVAPWKFNVQRDEPILGKATMKEIQGAQGDKRFTTQLIHWTSAHATLDLLDNGPDQRKPFIGSVAQACRQDSEAIACINGGFFHPDFSPGGLMICEQTRTGKWEDSSLLGGVWVKDSKREALLWKKEFQDHANIKAMIQAGPRLVVEGKPLLKFTNDRLRPRSFLITDGKQNWAFGKVDLLTLGDLATALSQLGSKLGWPVQRALNLDGGTSSGLSWRKADGQVVVNREWVTVRNILVLKSK